MDNDFKVVVQTEHTAQINSILFSPKTNQVVTASNDNFIRVWSTNPGQEFGRLVHILKGHTDNVTAIALQSDGSHLVSGGRDGKLILWDVLKGSQVKEVQIGNVGDKIIAITYSDDPLQNSIAIAMKGEKQIRIFDVTEKISEGKPIVFDAKSEVSSMLTFSSWKYIACGTLNGNISIIDIKSMSKHFVLSVSSFRIVAIGKLDEETIIWMDETGKIGRINTKTLSPLKETISVVTNGKVSSAIFNSKNHVFTFVTGVNVQWVDVLTQKNGAKKGLNASSSLMIDNGILVAGDMTGHLHWLDRSNAMKEIPAPNIHGSNLRNESDNILRAVAVGGTSIATVNQSYDLWVWSLDNGSAVSYEPLGKDGASYHLAYNDKGDRLIIGTGSGTGTLKMLYQDSFTTFGTDLSEVQAIEFIPKTDNFISCHTNGSLMLWDAKTKQNIYSVNTDKPQIGLSISQSQFVTIEKSRLRIWDVHSMKQLDSIYLKEGNITSCSIHPDNNNIAIGFEDGIIEIYTKKGNIYGRKNQAKVHRNKINRLQWMENTLFSCSKDGYINQSTDDLQLINESNEHNSEVWDFSIFPKHDFIASVGNDGVCIISSIKESKKIMSLIAGAPNNWIAVSNDGLFDASSSGIGYVNIVKNNMSMPLENYISVLEKPGILAKLVAGAGTKPVKSRNEISKLLEIKPPSISILSPISYDTVNQNEITVNVGINSPITDIEQLRVSVNGNIIMEVPQKELRTRMTIPIQLIQGKNLLRVEGSSPTGIQGYDTVRIFNTIKSKSKPNLYVVAVGISEYKNNKFRLKYALKDAESFCKSITENYSKNEYESVHIDYLPNEKATYLGISEAFEGIYDRVKPNDRFIFYYAGHGKIAATKSEGEYYLITYDVESMTDTNKLIEKGFSLSEMRKKFSKIHCSKKALIIDACHAGSITEFDDQSEATKELHQFSDKEGVYLMASALQSQQAYEDKNLKHGLYTTALLDGLNGKAASTEDGQVALSTLQDYIYIYFKKLNADNKFRNQNPIFRFYDSDRFVVTQLKN